MAQIVSTGKTLSTTEYLRRKNKVRQKRRIILSLILLAIAAAIITLSRLPSLQIRNVVVAGATVTGEDAVKETVLEILRGNYFWLVPRSNALVYGKDKMEAEIAERFPRFSSVELSLDGLQTLQIEVSERDPHALYCSEEERCFFLDRRGFIFDYAPNFSEGVYFVYREESPMAEPMGQFLLPAEQFESLSQFLEKLPVLAMKPLMLKLTSEDYVLTLSNGSRILWSKAGDLERTFGNLESFLNSPGIKAQSDFLSRVSELDLRTEDKVFYRFNE